jgi:acyl carrier protein
MKLIQEVVLMQKMFVLARKLLAEQLNINEEQITEETTFSDLEADSVDVVEMIMALEDIYDVEFPEDDLEYYPTLESLVTVLNEHVMRVRK